MASLSTCPDEIVLQILTHVPPATNALGVQPASRRLCRVAREPALWRAHCAAVYAHWHARHAFSARLAAVVSDTDWAALFAERAATDKKAAELLSGVIRAPYGDGSGLAELARLGADVVDYLIPQAAAGSDCRDVLARR